MLDMYKKIAERSPLLSIDEKIAWNGKVMKEKAIVKCDDCGDRMVYIGDDYYQCKKCNCNTKITGDTGLNFN